jgi:uridylate kinase
VGTKWDPGLNAPFDPVASAKARELGLKVLIMNGKNLVNLKASLEGKKLRGTTIS